MAHWTRTRLLVLTLALLAPVVAQARPDADDDGVSDAEDVCPDTEPSDIVGPDGCAVCACEDGAWGSHAAYVACVRDWTRAARAAGSVDAPTARLMVRRARVSTCGRPHLVRCCVYRLFDDDIGRCRLMTEGACDALDERLFDADGAADNEEGGSCLPNPCTF